MQSKSAVSAAIAVVSVSQPVRLVARLHAGFLNFFSSCSFAWKRRFLFHTCPASSPSPFFPTLETLEGPCCSFNLGNIPGLLINRWERI